ncbi:hypothetical protein IE81DRAFT_350487 [Ceraceosorus guamensis]|uniref:Uncharacterized protein n=1 Tax=Ceraceosorus guamensis TaxID=1522189 RepID=A0A316VNH6_9BASI|nr:hypothetical protein IE81DRAFT_350487 [Ceraceosorus guamensis]PWN39082.1 hypothetical protein IE81DRAFT_350487 [Ceraceosorus guamensis]
MQVSAFIVVLVAAGDGQERWATAWQLTARAPALPPSSLRSTTSDVLRDARQTHAHISQLPNIKANNLPPDTNAASARLWVHGPAPTHVSTSVGSSEHLTLSPLRASTPASHEAHVSDTSLAPHHPQPDTDEEAWWHNIDLDEMHDLLRTPSPAHGTHLHQQHAVDDDWINSLLRTPDGTPPRTPLHPSSSASVGGSPTAVQPDARSNEQQAASPLLHSVASDSSTLPNMKGTQKQAGNVDASPGEGTRGTRSTSKTSDHVDGTSRSIDGAQRTNSDARRLRPSKAQMQILLSAKRWKGTAEEFVPHLPNDIRQIYKLKDWAKAIGTRTDTFQAAIDARARTAGLAKAPDTYAEWLARPIRTFNRVNQLRSGATALFRERDEAMRNNRETTDVDARIAEMAAQHGVSHPKSRQHFNDMISRKRKRAKRAAAKAAAATEEPLRSASP